MTMKKKRAWPWVLLAVVLALAVAVAAWQLALEPLFNEATDLERADLYSRVYTGAVSGGLVIVAALIAFFGVRMNVNEQREQRLAADKRAADQLTEQQKRADEQHTRETLRDLRSRYSAAAEQISSDSTAMQQAGVYGLVALADDWSARDDAAQTQVCIDLLCAVARSAKVDSEVQGAILRIISERVANVSDAQETAGVWSGFELRLQNLRVKQLPLMAWVAKVDLSGAKVESLLIYGGRLPRLNLRGAEIEEGLAHRVSMPSLIMSNSRAGRFNFGSGVEMPGAEFIDADLSQARFACDLSDVKFTGADLRGTSFRGAINLDPRNRRVQWDETTTWPDGYRPARSLKPRVNPGDQPRSSVRLGVTSTEGG